MAISSKYRPAPRIMKLGDRFYDHVSPARFPKRELRFRNQRWADRIGLGELDPSEWEAHLARFEPLPENLEKPLALRYHGHQFDVYNPALGDGRGFLFAQLEDDAGRLLDLGTKGSGKTPWSRGADGRLTLKGGVREVLATEMLEALGVNTSKSLSLFETGEMLERGDEPSPTRSSVLVRLSHSHVRFGTFQRLAYIGELARLDEMLSYSIANYYPHLADKKDRVAGFLGEVARASAALTASWMVAGFVHGVLNSDNMVITGESFDYGPYRFLPTYDLDFVAAYFDPTGLYSYGRQPRAVFRNLVRLADALRPLAPDLALASALSDFERVLEKEITARVLERLGLAANGDTEPALIVALYAFLEASGIGYDRFFFDLHGGLEREKRALSGEAKDRYTGPRWDDLREILELYEPANGAISAYFDGDQPCTLLIGEVESIWSAIVDGDDWNPFYRKIEQIRDMGTVRARMPTPSGGVSSRAT
jgi:serine/tyrosine/threonine adenylyltransferase